MTRPIPPLPLAILAAAVLLAGCNSRGASDDHRASASPAISTSASAGPPTTSSASPHPASARTIPNASRSPAISTPTIPDPATATATAVHVARAWAVAANSSTYLDPNAGSWTVRAAPLVTGAEAAAERRQRTGQGGSTWAQIQAGKCAVGLRDLAAGIPSDAATGPDRHVVYVTAITALTCNGGRVRLSHFVAQLTVIRLHGRWLVCDVRH